MSNTVELLGDRGAKAFAGEGVASLYSPAGGRKYLNREERLALIAAAETLPPERALFVLTLAWTGARVSEVLALTSGSFQIERGLVAIITLKRRRHHVREVPLPPELTQRLARHFRLGRAEHHDSAVAERLWTWSRTTAWRAVKDAMRAAGVAGRPASPRGLRHAFGVGTLQAGVPINLVQRWLGHANMSTTAIYADATGPEEVTFASRYWRTG